MQSSKLARLFSIMLDQVKLDKLDTLYSNRVEPIDILDLVDEMVSKVPEAAEIAVRLPYEREAVNWVDRLEEMVNVYEAQIKAEQSNGTPNLVNYPCPKCGSSGHCEDNHILRVDSDEDDADLLCSKCNTLLAVRRSGTIHKIAL